MNKVKSTLVCLVFSIGAATVASAYSLSPTQTKFTLNGSASIVIDGQFQACTITMTGKVPRNSKNALIETFSDNGTCGVVAVNLPWSLRARDANTVTISNFAYNIPDNVCGAKTVHPSVSGSGVWTIQTRVQGSTSLCDLRTTLTSSPPITIVP